MVTTVGSITAAILKGSGPPHKVSPAMGLSTRKQLLPGSLGAVLLTRQPLAHLWVMWALMWCFVPSTHLPSIVKPFSSQNFDYKVSTLGALRDGRNLPSGNYWPGGV